MGQETFVEQGIQCSILEGSTMMKVAETRRASVGAAGEVVSDNIKSDEFHVQTKLGESVEMDGEGMDLMEDQQISFGKEPSKERDAQTPDLTL